MTRMGGERLGVAHVCFDEQVEELVLQVLRSGRIAQGPMVEALEAAAATTVGVRHAVAVSNGTASLIAALHVAGIGRGDEVITSPFTFGATLNAIVASGATARFADIAADDFNLSPASVESLVNDRTAAILPVHLFGQTADMTALGAIATRHGLAIIEDAAQALGARHRGRSAGSFGVGSFSLYATKTVTTGEGGLLTTDDDALAARARRFRNQGMDRQYDYRSFGLNFRLTDLQAAVGIPQLERLEQTIKVRVANATHLSAALKEIGGLACPVTQPHNDHVYHQYTVRIEDDSRQDRSAVRRELAEASIDTAVFYPKLVFDYECFQASRLVARDHCPVAAEVTLQVMSLPVHQHLADSDLDRVATALARALR
jgi:dTDP-4-amino-4,6-dideoxygalactose transaminase